MNRVVVYTPAEDFWFNSDLGQAFLMWLISLIAGVLIIYAQSDDGRKFKPWQFIALTGCVTYTLHYGLVWALTYL
jgi:hypothetical protein